MLAINPIAQIIFCFRVESLSPIGEKAITIKKYSDSAVKINFRTDAGEITISILRNLFTFHQTLENNQKLNSMTITETTAIEQINSKFKISVFTIIT